MHPDNNGNIGFCPHCGAENGRGMETWLHSLDNSGPRVCSHCKKIISEDAGSKDPDAKTTGHPQFNTAFFIIAAALLAGLIIFMNRIFNVLSFRETPGQIGYEILMVLLVSSAVASGKVWQNIKYLAIWAAIILILVVGYSYRHELSGIGQKVFAELVPSKGVQKTSDSISFPVSADGHFYILANVNGTPVLFLADTGASHIVLSPADAEKIGIKKDKLVFDRFYETANGTVRGSSVRIADFKIGNIHLKDLGASVNEATMSNSLLGMSFFKRFKSYEVRNNVLTLYK